MNVFRFVVTSIKQPHELEIILIGVVVAYEESIHEKFNVDEQLHNIVKVVDVLLALSTCIKTRLLENSTEVCPIAVMADCVNMGG